MSPSNQMEQDEDFKGAMAVLKELEQLVLDDNTVLKEQAEVVKSIEVEIDKCIQSLIARKEALIKAVDEQFKLKRDLMADTQQRAQSSIGGCKKLLDAGVGVYEASADIAKKTWKLAVDLKGKLQVTPYPITVQFTTLPELHSFGKIITPGTTDTHGTPGTHITQGIPDTPDTQDTPGLIAHATQALNTWLPNRKYNLVYKASRDGFKAAYFHKMCDNKGPTITIIRSQPHNYLFGGYTSQSWNMAVGYVNDPEAFIFTLTNPHGIPPTKYQVKIPANAIHNHPSRCVNFGGVRLSDEANNNANSRASLYNYEDTTGKGDATLVGASAFTPNEVEVYCVVPC